MGVLSRLFGSGREREILTDVVQAYTAERQQAQLLRHNAERARYPQAAEAMRLAAHKLPVATRVVAREGAVEGGER